MVAGRGIQFAITLLISLSVARLIGPDSYGLVAVALIVVGVVDSLTQLGFDQAIVQRRGDIDDHLGSTRTVLLLRSSVIAVFIWFGAPYVLDYIKMPDAMWLLRVIGLHAVIRSLANPRHIQFQRNQQVLRQVILDVTPAIAYLAVGVVIAVIYESAWALVLGLITSSFLFTMITYILAPRPPRFSIDTRIITELWQFGRWVWVSGIVGSVIIFADRLFVAKNFSESVVGLYAMAYLLTSRPVEIIGKLAFSWLWFSGYSDAQLQPELVRELFIRNVTITLTIVVPALVGIFLVGSDFTVVVLGPQWDAMIGILEILVFVQITRLILVAGGGVFEGIGLPKMTAWIGIVQSLGLIFGLWWLPGIYGISGVAYALGFSLFVALVVWIFGVAIIVKPSIRKLASNLRPLVFGVTAMVLTVAGGNELVDDTSARLLVSVFVGAAGYLITVRLSRKLWDFGGPSGSVKS